MNTIQIVPYDPQWPQEYAAHAATLKPAIRHWITRIDHIGSTAVPGLAARDILDVQISVPAFSDALLDKLTSLGYRYRSDLTSDHCPPGIPYERDAWLKQFFTEPPYVRRINVHIRVDGAHNQRYALLFRDYLRAHPTSAAAYGQVKQALAGKHPDDWDFYYEVKDPACDLIWDAARTWAKHTHWKP